MYSLGTGRRGTGSGGVGSNREDTKTRRVPEKRSTWKYLNPKWNQAGASSQATADAGAIRPQGVAVNSEHLSV